MNEKVLTVSIAAYNVEAYLAHTLDSLVGGEGMDRMEVLIVNDGSTDKTDAIAREYESRYPQVFRVINKENGGWGSTVNTGIQNATGKYFKLLDGDDWFSEDIPAFLDLLEKSEEDLVYSAYGTYDDQSGEFLERIFARDYAGNETFSDKDFQGHEADGISLPITHMNPDIVFAMHACAFRTERIRDLKVLEHCFYTDVEYLLRGLLQVRTVRVTPLSVYCYRTGREGQSVSLTGVQKHYGEHLRVTETMLALYRGYHGEENVREILFRRIRMLVDQQYKFFLLLEPTKERGTQLRDFDRLIRKSYPEFAATTRNRIKMFRIFGTPVYRFLQYR